MIANHCLHCRPHGHFKSVSRVCTACGGSGRVGHCHGWRTPSWNNCDIVYTTSTICTTSTSSLCSHGLYGHCCSCCCCHTTCSTCFGMGYVYTTEWVEDYICNCHCHGPHHTWKIPDMTPKDEPKPDKFRQGLGINKFKSCK